MQPRTLVDNTLRHLAPAVMFTVVSVIALGILYPLVMTAVAQLVFSSQANGSIVTVDGRPIASDIIGQLWKKKQYFHGRLSAAGNGYDPTSTGATNLGPTSKKLIAATAAAIKAIRKENPDATGPIPMDLITTSASGLDPDISAEAAYYQAARVAKARGMSLETVNAIIAARVQPRELGFLGEPRVNVLALNLALDAAKR